MKKHKRDLLLLKKEYEMRTFDMDKEVECLNRLLKEAESLASLSVAYELIDMNKHKIYHDAVQLGKALKSSEFKPFRFLVGRN